VVIDVVFRLDIIVVPDSAALAMFALAVTVIDSAAIDAAEISLSTFKSLVAMVPLTDMFPKVVVAPLNG
jgi:hypothetical protein